MDAIFRGSKAPCSLPTLSTSPPSIDHLVPMPGTDKKNSTCERKTSESNLDDVDVSKASRFYISFQSQKYE